jgi:hypothetical protein
MKTRPDVKTFEINVVGLVAKTPTADAWLQSSEKIAADASDSATAESATAKHWAGFWDRSWVLAETGGAAPSPVTRGYLLQRWMAACAGRGAYPIKFNGSIFTVEPKYLDKTKAFDADWRRWGDCYWWQNTRLPYQPMPAQGDFEQMLVLFRFFESVTPICEARAKLYYNATGVYFPETMTCFGTYANKDYGWNRKGHQPSEVLSLYWRYCWQQGLELVALMQDYYDYTQDAAFLREHVIPMSHHVLSYYNTRFGRDAAGKLILSPTQSIETYWENVVNDTPSVAGLISVLDRLLALPQENVSATERAFWEKMRAAEPPLPMQMVHGKKFLLPAEKFAVIRHNCENPELYAVTPFRLFGVDKPGLETAVDTFWRRNEKAILGWSYDGQAAALLGLTDEAKRQLLAKAANANPNYRFPAIWGPNYDWLPDQDHGSNLMMVTQYMLLQSNGDRLLLLPAWPKDWNVHFKLHAPKQTTVECNYRNGKILMLKVLPESRRKDIKVLLPGVKVIF